MTLEQLTIKQAEQNRKRTPAQRKRALALATAELNKAFGNVQFSKGK